MSLLKLFTRCLNAQYTNTYEDGDYAIEIQDDTLYLLFEWSRGRRDWYNNFNFPAKPYRRMDDLWFCHSGFLRVWRSMRDDIEEKVAATLLKNSTIKKISCVGYSHGAALAVFATEDMAFIYGEKYKINGYGFGCPRVLWGVIPAAVKKRLEHFLVIRNVPDLVTHVPPAALGYCHAGAILEIGVGEGYTPVKAHHAEAYARSLARLRVKI